MNDVDDQSECSKRGETDEQTEEAIPEAVGTLRCIDTCHEQNIKQ